jgi:hypothetical protein
VNGYWLSEAELDLLADFTAGVLDQDEYERVARLVGTDDRWATAHHELVEADGAVRSDLRAIAGPIATPPDVVARLDATIAGLADPVRSPLRPVRSRARGADRRRQSLPSAQQRRSRPDPSRWRRAGLAVVGVAAAAVVVGWGVPAVLNGMSRHVTGSAQSTSGDLAARGPAAPALPGGPPTMRSGRDYQPATLGQLSRANRGAASKATPTPAPVAAAPGAANGSTESSDSALPPSRTLTDQSLASLGRLADPGALRACLAAIDASRPGTPSLIDFAEFEGAPVLVVVVQQANSELAVVVGPACGLGGPDELYTATIGP